MDENPYRASAEIAEPAPKPRKLLGRARAGRFLAAQIDHSFGVVLFLAVGMSLGESAGNVVAGCAALATYFNYYFLPEWLCGTTLGKSLFALRVRKVTGERCSASQIAIRTL